MIIDLNFKANNWLNPFLAKLLKLKYYLRDNILYVHIIKWIVKK